MSSIDLSGVRLDVDPKFMAKNQEEILRNVAVILSTPVRTVPWDRDFGVNFDVIDLPINKIKARYTVEVITKIKKYEPRARVVEVTFEYVGTSGVIKPKVVLAIVNH
jgi:phage baseplate assembly protein W